MSLSSSLERVGEEYKGGGEGGVTWGDLPPPPSSPNSGVMVPEVVPGLE